MTDSKVALRIIENLGKLSKHRPLIEKDVKKAVNALVAEIAPDAHVFMPVQTGLGSPDLDFIITVNGSALRVETKVNHKQPSGRQVLTINQLVKAGTVVLVIDQDNLNDLVIALVFLMLKNEGQASAFRFAADSREKYFETK